MRAFEGPCWVNNAEWGRAATRALEIPVVVDPEPGSCGLAIAADPTRDDLLGAAAALSDGGWAYFTWRSAGWPSLRNRATQVRAAGFRSVHVYGAWPARGFPRVLYPVGASGAFRHFVDRSLTPSRTSPTQRVKAWAKRVLVGSGVLSTPFILARKLPSGEVRAGREPVLEWVRQNWPAWELGPLPPRLSCLIVTEGFRDTNKCVLLVFAEPDPSPLLAIKTPRVRAAVPALRREAENLRNLDDIRPCAGVPRIVWSGETHGTFLVVETAVAGRPLLHFLPSPAATGILLAAVDWITAFAVRTCKGAPDLTWRTVAESAARNMSIVCEGAMDDTLRRAGAVLDTIGPLPPIVEHRDFSPWNVLVSPPGTIQVVDWESSVMNGVPGPDLIYLLTYFFLGSEGIPLHTGSMRLREAFRRSLSPSTPAGQLRRRCLMHYADRVGVSLRDIESIALLSWMIHFQSEVRNFRSDAPERSAIELLRESVFVALLQESLAHCEELVAASGSQP